MLSIGPGQAYFYINHRTTQALKCYHSTLLVDMCSSSSSQASFKTDDPVLVRLQSSNRQSSHINYKCQKSFGSVGQYGKTKRKDQCKICSGSGSGSLGLLSRKIAQLNHEMECTADSRQTVTICAARRDNKQTVIAGTLSCSCL